MKLLPGDSTSHEDNTINPPINIRSRCTNNNEEDNNEGVSHHQQQPCWENTDNDNNDIVIYGNVVGGVAETETIETEQTYNLTARPPPDVKRLYGAWSKDTLVDLVAMAVAVQSMANSP